MEYQDLAKIVMNPVRQRIIQYLLLHPTGTSSEIGRSMPDVPVASLYRHMKKLLDAGCIYVVEERPVRGAVEKTYAIAQDSIGKQPTQEEMSTMFFQLLLSLQSSFLQYFERKDADPMRDMLTLQTSTLMLSDEEYMQLLQKLTEVINGYVSCEAAEGRKTRRLTFISSPPEN